MSILKILSPNFTTGRKIYKPEAVVIHIMEGTLSGTDSWFKNQASKVSAHYGIGKKGEVHQYVDEHNTAWHAGRVNAPGWSLIKPAGNGQYINPNYYTIGIEHEGNEESEWPEEMYASSSEMVRAICTRWNIPIDRKHIIGHHEIYSLKTCPGHKVDLNKLIGLASRNPISETIPVISKILLPGKATTKTLLNIRTQPNTGNAPFTKVAAGVQLSYDGFTNNGEKINGNSKWFFTHEGNWFWSGGVIANQPATITSIPAPIVSNNSTIVLPANKASIPTPATVPPDLPINHSICLRTAEWLKTNFGDKCKAFVADTPFTKELLYAIACQESAIYFHKWIDDHTPEEVLGRCVFDASGDVNGSRSAFPKNTAAFIAKYGKPLADELIAEANKTRALRGWGPKQWVYAGYGIFQYDLQFIITDESFFTKKHWYNIDDCLLKVIKELKSKWAAHPNDLFHTVKAYNGSGPKAENYANNVFQFLAWINAGR